ncbi:hypothetical protein CARUB_v10003390mg [Capsella rubella]|uniref:F-box domain-containing protein n=1 Tax=Capsella rubella TaxID=81985 RepID=R0FL37_9BRAS|nr:putative F-box/kelch-repeat protein At4g11770 [Capsella rubella]EOA22686.1 hypothetical protein CARUB_v10003390mg [Capsella rubella]
MATNSPIDLLHLPDDILLNCLARVSRLYYPTLSLVSKRLCSLVASLELYETRTLLGRTEKCLYVCLRLSSETKPRWFTLCRRSTPIPSPSPSPSPKPSPSPSCSCSPSPSHSCSPNLNPYLNLRGFISCSRPQPNHTINDEEKKTLSMGNSMVSVPTCNYYPPFGWPRGAIGSNIYMIGGYGNASYSSTLVHLMDCRTHTWQKAPSMQMARKHPLVNVLDGKIYVVKGCRNLDSSNMIEFFDPETQIWEYLPCPYADMCKRIELRSIATNRKLYLFTWEASVVYDPKENRWDVVGSLDIIFDLNYSNCSSCVIDNLIYYTYEFCTRIWWYDPERRSKGTLKGLEKLPKLPRHIRLVDYGGKLMLSWEKEEELAEKVFCCAEIELERQNEEIYGKIMWRDTVLKLSKPYDIVEVLTATV